MVTQCHGTSSPLFGRFCRSILSTKHDAAVHPINETESNEFKAFNEKVTQMFRSLSSVESHELLSVSWISKLLEGFLSCQEQFRALLSKNKACLRKHGLETSLSDYFERSLKSLDVCNAIRDGIEEMKLWTKQIDIALRVLNNQKTLGEAQFRRVKRALNDLEMKINDGKESGSNLAQRNRSFNLKKLRYQESEPLTHSQSFTWSVSRSWSASKQLQVIGKNIMLPKRSENIATNGLVLVIYTMSHVLHFVMWALVAAIPCQGRRAQSSFIFPKNHTWGFLMFSLQQRILDEYKKRDRKNTCGLLKEIHGSVSRSWSASKQVQAIGNNIVVPKRSEFIATNGLVLAIYTMSHVLHFVMWALVAAIPCQGRRAQSSFIFPKNHTWGFLMFSLQQRILEEYKKRDRKNTCGLLKEIHGVEMYTRYINGFSDTTKFPLEEEHEGEMKKKNEKLGIVYESLQNGLDPLERQVREVFLEIVRFRMEELDVLARPHE
ncbi:hypothetical protein CTI12_AA328180 [Artemisia annua]|uniref:BYPASS-related protein n=1 Tax=Artemisia annua TaxID=35608 RepID=A0A2U1MXI4_ARTAN|nr:hypothetical protein CTI12_AA328180 [Artemisia annua]